MRIQGVTGDLPAVATLTTAVPAVERPAEEVPPPAVTAAPATTDADSDSATADRRPRTPLKSFDPPLIAQRAVLGFPVGPMVAAAARESGISYSAAWAAVQLAMPEPEPTPAA